MALGQIIGSVASVVVPSLLNNGASQGGVLGGAGSIAGGLLGGGGLLGNLLGNRLPVPPEINSLISIIQRLLGAQSGQQVQGQSQAEGGNNQWGSQADSYDQYDNNRTRYQQWQNHQHPLMRHFGRMMARQM